MSTPPEHATASDRRIHEHHEAAHAIQLGHRLRLGWLLHHLPPRPVWSIYVLLNGFLTIALLGLLAVLTNSPFVFPSLGPTAYLFFFTPLSAAASPRNTILGHAVGLVCGYGAYTLFRVHPLSYGTSHGKYWASVIAAALALSLTGALMVLLRISHPPAGATTLIVALGILSRPSYLVIIEIAVILLTAQAYLINRLAGLPFPLWHARPGSGPHPKI